MKILKTFLLSETIKTQSFFLIFLKGIRISNGLLGEREILVWIKLILLTRFEGARELFLKTNQTAAQAFSRPVNTRRMTQKLKYWKVQYYSKIKINFKIK